MHRSITVLALGALIASAGALYAIKYDTAKIAADVTDLTDKVAKREAEIAVMRAEKANLLRPARIDALVKANLTLRPIAPKQLGRIADLPWKDEAAGSLADGPPVGLKR
jgi:cell division protein FtsL